MKTTLLFKKSLLDKEFIEITCKRWSACRQGISYIDLEGNSKIISTSNLYFWGIK